MDRQIEALHHGCADCGKQFQDRDRIITLYRTSSILQCMGLFKDPIEIGIAGGEARNSWVHYNCQDRALGSVSLIPEIRMCLVCKAKFSKDDMVIPVFQIIGNDVVNPSDPTDVGIALGERVYFAHHDCRNQRLDKKRFNIVAP